ncbi:MAG TPA: hypothetical protein VIU38_12775 [Anaerolineales bacterium]
MRVTRESLIRIAKQTTQERSYNDLTIVAAYLTGSLISEEDPLLGGTTDIDLVLVHNKPPATRREIVRLTPDFHLDIHHRDRADFGSPRELRTDPVLGWELYDPMVLYQRENFFDFVQAGLRAGFEFGAPALVLRRSRILYESARKAWMDLSEVAGENAGATDVRRYLEALQDAVNAVAELNGAPLAERRLLLNFPARAQAAERPAFTATIFNLLGAPAIDAATLESWLEPWKLEFLAATERGRVDGRIHAARINYYEKSIRLFLSGETPLVGLWPLINTWTLAACVLFAPLGEAWLAACHQLGLIGPGLDAKLAGLDNYLDEIEVRLDEIAAVNGLETSTSL